MELKILTFGLRKTLLTGMEQSDVRVMIQEMMRGVGLIENPMNWNMNGEGDMGKGVHTRIPLAFLPSILQQAVAITALIPRLVNAMVITRSVVTMVIQGSHITHL
jgi:hypothetical protein